MKKTLLLFFILLSFLSKAQNNKEPEKIKLLAQKVVQYFNAQQPDSLYSLAGKAFRQSLSQQAFEKISKHQLFPLGEIKTLTFESENNGVVKYKAIFNEINLSLFISQDDSDKFQVFLFKPYKAESKKPFVKSNTDNKLTSATDQTLDSLVQPFMHQSQTVGLSIGLLKNGQTSFYNYGKLKLDSTSALPTNKHLYEIGSITKTFTGWLLAQACIDKKLKLTDNIHNHLPPNTQHLSADSGIIQVVHLSNHSSGLPALPSNFTETSLNNPYKNYTTNLLYDYLKNYTLQSNPGTTFSYSNVGVGILGNILERVYSMPYHQLIQQYITKPLQLKNTKQFLAKPDSLLFMQGYDAGIQACSQWDFKALAAAGCLRSNTDDMLKYAQYIINNNKGNKVIELLQKTTFYEDKLELTLNWFLQDWGNGKVMFHGGQTNGYKSFLAINTKTKNAVIILSNTAVNNDEIGVALINLLDNQ